jgi:hypothetical protein
MAETTKNSPRGRRLLNGSFPKPPFWLTSTVLVGACGSFLLVATLLNSRTSVSEKPRVHFIQDMDNQVKRKTQSTSEVFADGRSSRPPIAGTVKFDSIIGNDALTLGYTRTWNAAKNSYDVTFEQDIPVKVDEALLKTGEKKFNTYCMPCHGFDGTGNGPINQRAQEVMINPNASMNTTWVQPSNLTDEARVARPNGHLFNTITNGIRNMAGYGQAIPDAHDRWAVVAYVRALQLSHTGFKETAPAPATQPVASAK